MILYEENSAFPLLPTRAKIISLKNSKGYINNKSLIPAKNELPVLKEKKIEVSETIVEECKMPPQPQGYLKYPKYDFF